MKIQWAFIDGVARNAEHPESFLIPDPSEIRALRPGDWVKVGIEWSSVTVPHGERLWLRLTVAAPGGGEMEGTVFQSDMVCFEQHGIADGSTLKFRARHVLAVLPASAFDPDNPTPGRRHRIRPNSRN